jgi:hypothetical protein
VRSAATNDAGSSLKGSIAIRCLQAFPHATDADHQAARPEDVPSGTVRRGDHLQVAQQFQRGTRLSTRHPYPQRANTMRRIELEIHGEIMTEQSTLRGCA